MEEARKSGLTDGYERAVEEQCRAFSASLARALSDDFAFNKEQIIAVQDSCNKHIKELTPELIDSTIEEYLTDESEGDFTEGL